MSNLYEERDIIEQGEHYTKHISAMTCEGLHSKSAIAAELAHRDIQLEQAEARVAELEARAGESTELLNEHFIEWELDSGSWNEFAWHEKVANFLDVPRTGWLLRKQAEAVANLSFPVFIRKMHSGADVQEWIDSQAQHIRQQAKELEEK